MEFNACSDVKREREGRQEPSSLNYEPMTAEHRKPTLVRILAKTLVPASGSMLSSVLLVSSVSALDPAVVTRHPSRPCLEDIPAHTCPPEPLGLKCVATSGYVLL